MSKNVFNTDPPREPKPIRMPLIRIEGHTPEAQAQRVIVRNYTPVFDRQPGDVVLVTPLPRPTEEWQPIGQFGAATLWWCREGTDTPQVQARFTGITVTTRDSYQEPLIESDPDVQADDAALGYAVRIGLFWELKVLVSKAQDIQPPVVIYSSEPA